MLISWTSLVPSSALAKSKKESGQICIGPMSPAFFRVCTNQVQVFKSHDVKNAVNSHSTGLCNPKIVTARADQAEN